VALRLLHFADLHLDRSFAREHLYGVGAQQHREGLRQALRRIVEPFAAQATLKWILDNRLPTPGHFRYNRAVREIDRVVYHIISERRASGAGEGDLLSMLLRAQDEDGTQMTDRQLRDEVMTLFLAGHETTALALTWAWYLLARNPETEEKLHAELDRVLEGGRPPTAEDLPALRYTEMVVAETMRLYPPAYAIGRLALEDHEVGGYRIPRGSLVLVSQYVMHRDPRFFPEPERFDPTRFAPEARSERPQFSYFPFGGGVRRCIGEGFAWTEAVLILAALARRWAMRLAPGHRVEAQPRITLRPGKGGVVMTLKSREP